MKTLHSADWHLRDKDIDEASKCLAFLVETAKIEMVDLVAIAGDIFHSQDTKLDSKASRLAIETVSTLADIAPVVIVIGTASHDGHAPEILRYARGKYQIFVADKPQQIYLFQKHVLVEVNGINPDAVLTLIPQPTKQFFQTTAGIEASDQEIGKAMSGLFAGFGAQAAEYDAPHVLVYHGCVSGGLASNSQIMTGRDITVSRDQLDLSGASLFLCGHLHLPQELPGSVFYSGSIYTNNVGEDHKHGFYIHEYPKTPMGVFEHSFIETPCRRTVRFKRDLAGDEVEPIYVDGVSGASVRLEITVWQDEAAAINKDEIRQTYMEAGALDVDIRINRIPRVTVRSETVLKAATLTDKIRANADLKGEEVEWSVLAKADLVESVAAEELIARVMGIKGMDQAIPPAYTEFIGRQIMEGLSL